MPWCLQYLFLCSLFSVFLHIVASFSFSPPFLVLYSFFTSHPTFLHIFLLWHPSLCRFPPTCQKTIKKKKKPQFSLCDCLSWPRWSFSDVLYTTKSLVKFLILDEKKNITTFQSDPLRVYLRLPSRPRLGYWNALWWPAAGFPEWGSGREGEGREDH